MVYIILKPRGAAPRVRAIQAVWHMTGIFPKGGGMCALLGSNRQRVVEQTTRPVNVYPSVER